MHNYLKTVLVFSFCSVFLSGCISQHINGIQTTEFHDHQKVTAKLHDQTLTLEVVNTPQSMAQGLSNRTEIGCDGMLFLLGNHGTPRFWMREMLFDLDFIWLKDDTVTDITLDAKKPVSFQDPLQIYSPTAPANMVLEVNAGKVAEWRVQKGDVLTFTSEH